MLKKTQTVPLHINLILMKKLLALLTLFLMTNTVRSQSVTPGVFTIDQFDTVFFDLQAAVVNGNKVEFPVYYKSDDQIVALDFNFKYNQSKLDYDTIIKLANYLDALAFYNANDSTVRLTSYTNTLFYPNDSVLFKVRFDILQPGPLCSGDLSAVNSLLNGDICTSKKVDCTTSLVEESIFKGINIGPNPTSTVVNIQNLPGGTRYRLTDMSGRTVLPWATVITVGNTVIDMQSLPAATYLFTVETKDGKQESRSLIRLP